MYTYTTTNKPSWASGYVVAVFPQTSAYIYENDYKLLSTG